ncbi:class II fructose-bisphosphate aldolase family protein [Sporosarcina sp. Marseille-Q4063]|uniref:class II fructose-bisphosphate aldolase n=1 Tax=Sporosarcina sp. Marseille-Q4063 TaxID=2810514 RepID=UPI001BB0881B|nr:class II fructose-bisphosphate aldolase [Sporosarcina sp. Marseille-Q4063]QUW21504.1 class II fructose-bisphosphate aldolase family protein [Sporosarcina sp. Marseille-Q4063]
MLVNLNEVLRDTLTMDYAVPAFNIFGYEDAKAIIEAAEELNAPVILATNKVAITHMPISILGRMLTELAERTHVPVVVHLDHGSDYETVRQALQAGYSSVMYDGSQLEFEENIRTTKSIVQLANSFGIPVEAEIGSVGYSDSNICLKSFLTDPFEAKEFAERTGVDALAVAVGTLHRMEEQTANIQYELIEEIQSLVNLPLVMHGSTGIRDADLKKITKTNFGKVNIGTAIRMAFGKKLREEILAHPEAFDRLDLFQLPMQAVKREAMHKIKLLNTHKYQEIRGKTNK